MSSLKLYEIRQLYIDTFNELDEQDEVDLSILEDIKEEFSDKGLAVLAHYKNSLAEIECFKQAEKSIKLRRDALNKRNEALKQYLLTNMLDTGISSLESPFFSCKIKNNPPHVEILDEAEIPDEFKQEIVTIKVDKMAIKRSGGCAGVELVRDRSLKIT